MSRDLSAAMRVCYIPPFYYLLIAICLCWRLANVAFIRAVNVFGLERVDLVAGSSKGIGWQQVGTGIY